MQNDTNNTSNTNLFTTPVGTEVNPWCRDQKEVEESHFIRDRLLKRMQITELNRIDKELSSSFRKLEDILVGIQVKTSDDFYYLHVEMLLDQAVSLLERGLKDRAEYDELMIKSLNQAVEFGQYYKLDEIHDAETISGFYERAEMEAESEFNIEESLLVSNSVSQNKLTDLINNRFNDNLISELIWQNELSAWIGGRVHAQYPKAANVQELEEPIYTIFDIKDKDGNILKQDASEVLQKANRMAKIHELQVQKESLELRQSDYKSAANSTEIHKKTAYERLQWEKANKMYKKGRTEVLRRFMDLKAKSIDNKDGILNYDNRINAIEYKFTEDFMQAYSRINKIAEGFASVYGTSPAIKPDITLSGSSLFDDCLVYARKLINWLVKFNWKDQSYILPISLRNLMSFQEWVNGTKINSWKFNIREDLFSNQYHVRLRGVNVFVMELKNPNHNGLIKASFKAPRSSFSRHLDLSVHKLDQTDLPYCKLGRIGTRDFVRSPETVGTTSLYNAAPFGVWEISLDSALGGTLEFENIFIDLHVTVRTQ